jgi:hypothetical protein
MKADLRAELGLLHRNVDGMIRLFQCATDAGIWTREEAERHESRLELLRAKLNADFRELMALRERANGSRLNTENLHRPTKNRVSCALATTQMREFVCSVCRVGNK